MERYLSPFIKNDLKEKMVFLGGPRQVGKTTIALQLLGVDDPDHPAYLNWDHIPSKKKILSGLLPTDEKLIIFDEIHKYLRWRNLIKGLFDQYKVKRQFLVTGSARLDYYRKGGDSLQGRYHFLRLHPLSFYELGPKANQRDFDRLFEFGGFPEPFLKASKKHWQRWQNERATRVIQEDLMPLEKVREISRLEHLMSLLPERVGSVLSVNSLREDLEVKFETIDRWISIFENIYFCFRIPPYSPKHLRTAKKEKKLYLWDWSLIVNKGSRFENLVASNLLKYVHFHNDVNGDNLNLCFLRDSEKREIDFIITRKTKPVFAVECKTGERELSPHIRYFSSRTDIPQFYQLHLGHEDLSHDKFRARLLPFTKFVQILKV